MDSFQRRYAEAREADDARNALIADLLQQVNDMRKTMERNAFVLVLIDGDNMNFLNDLVKQGIQGGDEAAKRLRRSVFEYLRYDADFKHDQKIVIRIYANIRGLCKTYAIKGVLPNAAAFSDFVLGFNKAHPLCDFIDAGNQKEAADTKIKEVLTLHVHNVHCKHIIFGASADNAYPSFLSSFSTDTDIFSRIRILKGPPFSFEFKQILGRFKWTEFKDVFRSEFISNEAMPYRVVHETQDVEPAGSHQPWPWISKKNAASHGSPDVSVNTPMFEEAWNPYDAALQAQNRPQKSSHGDPQPQSHNLKDWNEDSPPSKLSQLSRAPLNIDDQFVLIGDELVRCTWDRLQESPKALDFGVVKHRVEANMWLPSRTWEDEPWLSLSKTIIKMAVEDWVERTDNPPPKNATWMLRFFPPGQSPSAVMKDPASESWRTRLTW